MLGEEIRKARQKAGLMRLEGVANKERYLKSIDEAAGKFRALANLVRHTN